MTAWLWVPVLLAAGWAAHWGAERLADPLKKLRQQWGFSAAAGGTLIGIASASPEIGINIASAVRGVADIGLGAMLGANTVAIPLVVTVAYWASRRERLGGEAGEGSEGADPDESPTAHRRHVREGLLHVRREAVTVQALPYLAILALVAALTLPARWRGLQPVDGWILLAAYGAYVAQALLRGREDAERVDWSRKEIALAVAGVLVLALGAYFTVRATEGLVAALGIPKLVGGLFITAPVAALPETFAVWSVTRSGQVTSATTGVLGDQVATMTVTFLPLALTSTPVDDLQLFWVSLAFVAAMPVAFAALVPRQGREAGFTRARVLLLDAVYVAYLAVMDPLLIVGP